MHEKEYCISLRVKSSNDALPEDIEKDLKVVYEKIHTNYWINSTHVDVVKDSVIIAESKS